MTHPRICAVLFLVAAALPASLSLRADEEPATPLHTAMEKIEEGIKKLRRDLKEPAKNESSLAIVIGIQEAMQQAKQLSPALAAKKPDAERPGFVKDFRKSLIAVQKDVLDLEIALLDGDNARAQELYRKIHDSEDPAHEKFTEDG